MNVIVWSVFVYGRFQHENTLKCPLSVILFVKKLIKMTITTLPFLCVRRKFPYFFFFLFCDLKVIIQHQHFGNQSFASHPKQIFTAMNIQKHCINVRDGFINLHLLDKKTKTKYKKWTWKKKCRKLALDPKK